MKASRLVLFWIGVAALCGFAAATSPLTIDRQEIKEAIHARAFARYAANTSTSTPAQQVDYQRACERVDKALASTRWKWGKGDLVFFIGLEEAAAISENRERFKVGLNGQ